jgi:hypothetical protein
MNVHILKTAALELQLVDSKDVVKVAGIFARIKNWWRAFNNPEYRKKVYDLREDSVRIQTLLDDLNENIETLQRAINDTDVPLYEKTLGVVKDYSLELAQKLVELQRKAKEATDSVPEETANVEKDSPEIAWVTSGFKQDKDVVETLKKQLPTELDIPIGRKSFGKSGRPVTEFEWMKQFSADNIYISGEVEKNIFNAIVEHLSKDMPAEDAIKFIEDKKYGFINNLKEAILTRSKILEYDFSEVSTKITHRPARQMRLKMAVYDVQMPGTNYTFDFPVFTLDDLTPSAASTKSLRFFWAKHIRPSLDAAARAAKEKAKEEKKEKKTEEKKASRMDEIKKFAGHEVKRQRQTYTKSDLANLLIEGYRSAFGREPNAQMIGAAWSQLVFEHGQPIMVSNNNFGNISNPNPRGGSDYYVINIDPKKNPEYTATGEIAPIQKMYFKSNSTPLEGIKNYWNLLANRYPEVLARYAQGDAFGGAVRAGELGYYTGSIKSYSTGVDSLFDEFMRAEAPKFENLSTQTIQSGFPRIDYVKEHAADKRQALDFEPKSWKHIETGVEQVEMEAPAVAKNVSGHRRAQQSEVTPEMTEIAKQILANGDPIGSQYAFTTSDGKEYIALIETHTNAPGSSMPGTGKPHRGVSLITRDVQLQQQEQQMPQDVKNQYEEIMRYLTACGPVEKLVRRAFERANLPTTRILLVLSSDESFPVQVRFAHILSSALRSEIDADSAIYHNGKNIEIECDISGSEDAVVQAVRGVSDGISAAFKQSTKQAGGFVVNSRIYPKLSSSYRLLDSETSETSFRKFAFEIMG